MPKDRISKTIAIGETQTEALFLNEYVLNGFILSGSVITGSQVTFLVAVDNSNYYPLYADGVELNVEVSGSVNSYVLDYNTFRPFNQIKMRLGFSGSSVAQKTYPLTVYFLINKGL